MLQLRYLARTRAYANFHLSLCFMIMKTITVMLLNVLNESPPPSPPIFSFDIFQFLPAIRFFFH